jgi:hypothetical protein
MISLLVWCSNCGERLPPSEHAAHLGAPCRLIRNLKRRGERPILPAPNVDRFLYGDGSYPHPPKHCGGLCPDHLEAWP